MEIGMLWYDDSPIALKDRVKQAADYYSEKFGRKPNLCFVHPDMLQTDEGRANGVVIRKGKHIMPGHFWIGVDQAEVQTIGNQKTGSKVSAPNPEAAVSKAAANSKTVAAPSKPKSKAKSPAATTARPKGVKKPKPGSTKPASKKPASAKPGSRKPASAKLKAKAKPKRVNRTNAYLRKKSGSRVSIGDKPKSKTKSTKSKANSS